MKKKILITGGLGYIGTELCRLYSGQSWYNDIVVIDKKFVSERVNQLRQWNIDFFQGDILDKELIKKILKDTDCIHHLAGITNVAYVKKESTPERDKIIEDTAIEGTRNILNFMKEESKIIFPSTHVVFDGLKNTKLNITEKEPGYPILAYSKSKYQNELDIISSGKRFNILRLGSVYGYSGDATRIKIMPNLFSKITAENGLIKLFSGGKQFKSLVPLIDTARGFKFFEESDEFDNQLFNFTKDNLTVKDVARICKKINPQVQIKETNDEIPNHGYTLSNKKLLQTGFKFLYNIEENLSEMINKWSKNKNDNYWTENFYYGANEFIDKRGLISNFELSEPINLIGYITSKKGSIRANHYHPVQEQKCLLVKGQYISITKNLLDPNDVLSTNLVNSGEIVVTRPNVAHAMLFTQDSILLNLVRGEREHDNYGITHTIREIILDEKLKYKLLKGFAKNCRCCSGNKIKKILSLGCQPLANNLLNYPNQKFETYPLDLMYCIDCYNFQLSFIADKKKMFKNYLYLSSTSKSFIQHFENAALKYIKKFNLNKNSKIIDIGSNDGIGLKPFQSKGFKNIIGIEPAKNLAKITSKLGIKTVEDFCSKKLAKKIKGKFDLILASNVYAHNDDIKGMTVFVRDKLKQRGIFIIEVQHILRTLKDLTFDNIYHEHVNYWSLLSLEKFLEKFNLEIFDAESIDTHGGSLRVYVSFKDNKKINHKNINKIKQDEVNFGINNINKIKKFETKIIQLKKNFIKNFENIKKKYTKISFYGSPAKATTRLNYFNVDLNKFEIIEDNKLKIKKYMPGTKMRIIESTDKNIKENDCIIVLAWNFINEIQNKIKTISQLKVISILDLENKN